MGKTQAVAYLRVSTVGQVVDGVSLEAQRARIESWAAASGFELIGIYSDEGISGSKTRNRPGLAEALDIACRHGATLCVYSLTRMARSTVDCITIAARLEKAGANLVSIVEQLDSTSASGKMMFRMLAVLGEFERDIISERTRTALAFKKSRGELTGKAPYGWQVGPDGVHLEVNHDEQEIIRCARVLHASGISLRKVAALLEADGKLPRSGRSWHAKTIQSLLGSEMRNAA